MQRTIATQADFQALQDSLSELAQNLNAHINQSLSKAHGIQVMPGYVDTNGNDLTTYQNSNGDIVGTRIVTFNVNGVIYYAPANDSLLAGKPETTGELSTSGQTEVGVSGAEVNRLVTDYTSTETQSAINTDNLLLQHTITPHAAAHGPLTVVNVPYVDNKGHTVGRYTLEMIINGTQYGMPCDNRLGGPTQPPRLSQFNPRSFFRTTGGGGGGNTFNVSVVPIVSGTRPFTYAYEYLSNGVWAPITPDTANVPIQWNVAITPPFAVQYSSTTGVFTFVNGSPEENDYDYVLVRLIVTGPDGIPVNTDANGNFVTVQFGVQHQSSGCCWFCTECNLTRRLAPEEWRAIGQVEKQVFALCRRAVAWYIHYGDQLVQRMRAAGVPATFYEQFTEKVLDLWLSGKQKEAALFYVQEVVKATVQYWPECAHRGLKAGAALAAINRSCSR